MAIDWKGMVNEVAPFLSPLLGNSQYKNPADAAMPYLNQMQGNATSAMSPYIEAGQRVAPGLEKQYGQLMENPGGRLNEIGAGFHESPGYQWALQQALNAGNHKAGAGGYAGTPMHEQNAMTTATGLANQDYGNWLNHATNLYGQGLTGGQNMYQTGFEGSKDMAKMIQDALENKAGASYYGAQDQNKQNQGLWGTIGNIASAAIPFFL